VKYLLTILLVFALTNVFANTIEVGKNKVISSLKKGIEIAVPGDTILLYKGVYKEGNIILNKSVHLIGIDEPVLDGEDKFEILTVSGHSIVVKGIHFKNSGYSSMNDYASINLVDADNFIIENNIITNSYFAIHVSNAREGIIRNNHLTGNFKSEQSSGNGIHLWKCEEILIEDNFIEGHRDGIYFEFVHHSIIQNNNSKKNVRYGLHFMFSHNNAYIQNTFMENGAGVAVMYSNNVLMMKNNFDFNWGPSAYGLLLKEINDSRILKNHFHKNTIAIFMEGSNRLDVQLNSFTSNGWSMKVQASCTDNVFHHNNFQGNTFDVATNGSRSINIFYNNYWDKYEGYDLNRDMVGDVPHHPVSMYSMIIEQDPNALMLLRSFMVSLLDKAEKAIPSLTPEHLVDKEPLMKPLPL
jgi:nitrous oxidase accessory protein